jgi:hypothetical protein
MAKAPFKDSRAPSWLTGPGTDVPAEPPSHMPCLYIKYLNLISTFLTYIYNYLCELFQTQTKTV